MRDRKQHSQDQVSHRSRDGGSQSHTNLIYGVNSVEEALRARTRPLESIMILENARPDRLKRLLALAREAGVPVRRVPKLVFDRDLTNAKHQGVVAKVAAARYANAEDLLDSLTDRIGTGDPPLAVGLDGIEDPRNLGSILRTAECAGVQGVFVPERRASGLTDVVAKVSAGALEYVPVARVTNMVRLIEQLKERNIWVIGASADAGQSYTDWDWKLPVAVFLGNEGRGLHRLVSEKCDALVRIPVSGQIGSLNVAVAAGVLFYEARRQRANLERASNSAKP